ncbi:MAG: GspE/PulE family protein [Nitrospiraceae bacterium]|uniref:GspE/PulE family protein n=1 Tax=Nitrospira cf. moscoviensis SBR1015 TaxID=96242 RepID=UPI000B3BBF4C|nr:GspE/PulE family protein [Nitrospira cf. moscoviensis SBR1015]MBY0249397.1 GspE/PulE family protein [Nitrospiraceae bacterium]
MERSLLDCLAYRGLISPDDLDAAVKEALSREVDLETVLLDKYHVPKSDLGAALSEFYQCPYVPFDERTVIDPDLLKNLSFDYLRNSAWIPLKRQGTVLDVVINDPHDLDKGLDIRRAFPGVTIRFSVGLRRDIEQYILVVTGQADGASITDILGELVNEAGSERTSEVDKGDVDENDSAIVRLANQVIADAYRLNASDVHIEPYSDKKETAVRLRVDGTCFTYMRIPAVYRRAIISRIKIMANLDIAERRKPQDGKIRYKLAKDRQIELRIATLPTAGGNEDVVMRLLTAKETMPLEVMDFAPDILQAIKSLAVKPHGIVLCVGPTGSGKTTTLHAVLRHINTDERKIWTAEDPIEITQEGLRQVQVHPKIGFTFAAALRAFLRADPDVIMIGEMRDKETADIAIEASLTGHLVLSTLHTNSAVETVTRLLDMGCDSFNFADAMQGIVAKRLCKRICEECKEGYHPTRQEYDELVQGYGAGYWERLGVEYTDSLVLYRGRGCEVCNRTGFKGRIPLHELLVSSEEVKGLIQSKARSAEILKVAMREGMVTLVQDGIQKVLRGVTTYRQIRTVAMK